MSVLGEIETMVVAAGMPAPLTGWPTIKPVVSGTTTAAEPFVVVPWNAKMGPIV